MRAIKTSSDPVFVRCAEAAPSHNLAFYLTLAGRPASFKQFGERTPTAICGMATTYAEIIGPKPGTLASRKRRAYEAIDRYKASLKPQPWDRWVDLNLVRTFDVLDAMPAADGLTLFETIDRYNALATPDPWWPTELTPADILSRALDAATRFEQLPALRAIETLTESIAAEIGVEDVDEFAIYGS